MTVSAGAADASTHGRDRTSGPGTGRRFGPHYKWFALSNTTLGVLMATINQSILLIALPDVFRGLRIDPLASGNTSLLLWMMMGFLVVSAVLVVSFGRLGDMFGRVRMYNMGFAIFTVASILLTVTWMHGTGGALWIILWRVVQGVGGAFLFANSTAILTDAFPVSQRGTALGLNAIAAIAGSFIGLILGGVLGPLNWRLVFLVSAPFGAFGTVWAYLVLHDIGARRHARMDWWGNLLFGAGLVAILVGITYGLLPYGGHPMGWTNPWVLAALLGGAAALVAFGFVETKVAEPMLKLTLFRIRAFAAGNLANLLLAVGRGGMQFILIIWLQGIWLPLHGYSFSQTPLWAGIYLVPLTVGFLISAPLSGALSDRFGARAFTVGGTLLTALSFGLLMLLPVNFSYWAFAVILVANGFGSGLFASPNRAEIMNSVPADQRGASGGTIATFQNTAFVLSIGIFFTLIVAGLSGALPTALSSGLIAQGVPASAAHAIGKLPPIGVLFAAFLGYNPMRQLLGPVLAHLSAAHVAFLTGRRFFPDVITHPFHDGLTIAFWFAIAASLAAAVSSLLTGRGTTRRAAPGATPVLAAAAAAATRPPTGTGPVVTAAGGITGLVRDQTGRPVVGAVVTVTTTGGRQLAREVTDADGRYRVGEVGDDPVTVIVTARGFEPAAATVLARRATLVDKDMVLVCRGRVTGSVRSVAGDAPLPGAHVVVTDAAGNVVAGTVTGADGGFAVDGPPTDGAVVGRYAVTATAPGHRPVSRDVTIDGQAVVADLVLPTVGAVQGTVRGPDGSPVPGVLVTAATPDGDVIAATRTGPDGGYLLTTPYDGPCVVAAAGHDPASVTVDVPAGGTTTVTVCVGPAPADGAASTGDLEPAATGAVTVDADATGG